MICLPIDLYGTVLTKVLPRTFVSQTHFRVASYSAVVTGPDRSPEAS
jgi:hypothetical protein